MNPNQRGITWTGTSASAAKLVDEVNKIDGGTYASGEIVDHRYVMAQDPDLTLELDTLSNRLTIKSGEQITFHDGKWVVA